MKAIVYERYGGPEVLELRDLPKPEPKPNEVLIKVHATTVSVADSRLRGFRIPFGFRTLVRIFVGWPRPRKNLLGFELSGEVEATGQAVTRYAPGDRVFSGGVSSYVEYKCVSEDGALAPMPAHLSYEEAAAICFGGLTALVFFEAAKIRRGDTVLVNGASGAVGTAAIQLAKHFGAEVTGVCSTGNAVLVASLGADKVIDYTQEDFTGNGERYDIIVDAVGNAGYGRCKRSLKPGGRLLLVIGSLGDMLRAPVVNFASDKRIIGPRVKGTAERLRFLASLCESREYRPVIDRVYSLDQIQEAHRYVDTGRKRGNVVVTF